MDIIGMEEELVRVVQEILPHVTEEKATAVSQFMMSEGVKKLLDLRHMTIHMLKAHLDTVDSTDLYVEFQNRYGKFEIRFDFTLTFPLCLPLPRLTIICLSSDSWTALCC